MLTYELMTWDYSLTHSLYLVTELTAFHSS